MADTIEVRLVKTEFEAPDPPEDYWWWNVPDIDGVWLEAVGFESSDAAVKHSPDYEVKFVE